MLEKIVIPDIGDFQEVEIIEVLVAAGDAVTVEQPLITLESDKATMDVPSPFAGTIREVRVKAGDKVSEGSHIADIELSEAAASSAPAQPAPAAEPAATASPAAPAPPPAAEPPPPPAAAAAGGTQEVHVPNIGDFQEVEIIEMLVNVGDTVTAEQPLLTLESDKATMDVPSPIAGRIEKLLVSSGDKVSEGTLIAVIAAAATATAPQPAAATPPAAAAPAASSASAAPAAPPPSQKPAPTPPVVETKSAKPYAGPAVRHFARELGVDLSAVQGSGRKGRILREDVAQHVKTKMTQPSSSSGFAGIPPMPDIDFRRFGEIEMHPLSRINRLSAATLHRNWLTAPHVTQFAESDITDMENFRQSLTEEAKANGYRMTPLVFLIKAAVASLRQFPKFNSSLLADGENLAVKKYYHIGVAVDTPDGLVVPVIRDANQKGLTDIARELADISERARAGKLKKEDMQGGCFTISSLGGVGGTAFTPILNLPEVAILGVSRSQTKPQWDPGSEKFIPRLMLPLSLSYDHRVIDGAAAARFITYYSELLSDIRRLTL